MTTDPPEMGAVDVALVRAHGQLVALVATLLARAGVVPVGEFGAMLGVYATVIAETEPMEGDILALWADTVSQLASTDKTH
jgi:hypothetical protein